MKPFPLEILLIFYALAVLLAYWKWRWALRGAGWTVKEKWLIYGLVVVVFISLAILDAFYNRRFGFPQF